MAYPGLAHEDHKYLGKEYCTGYADVYGKWNTGFYCPQYGSKTAVFCCGTAVFKYCCTNQEPVDPNSSSSGVLLDGDDPNFDGGPHHGVSSAVFVRVPIVFGVVCGIAAVLVLLIVAGCYFCSCCFAYKKRRNDHPHHNDLPHHLNHLHLNHPVLPPPGSLSQTGLYRNSTPSTNSTTASNNLLNLYSGSAGCGPLTSNSLVTTPLDLDWASSIASSYQSQQQLFPPPALHFTPPPHGPGPGNPLTPAAAASLVVALSQQQRANLHHPTSTSSGSLLAGGTGTPSVISGTTLSTSNGRIPSVSQAYQSFLNSSTSTLSSSASASVPARVLGPPQPQLHRANLPQQISTTASIVNSYLTSLQQAQHVQSHSEPAPPTVPPPPAPLPPVERTRHPSPPPSYFQTVSSASYHGGSNNNYINNNRNSRQGNQNSQRQNRMATIQSILGGSASTWSTEDDLLIADFLLRHDNTLRRSLGLPNTGSNNNRSSSLNSTNVNLNNTHNNSSNSTTSNNNSRNRGNPMLTQRELIELLLRLTSHGTAPPHSTSSTASSISRSDSRAGSDSHSTASSVATTRSTASAASTTSNGKNNSGPHPASCTKLTISEVEEDDVMGIGQGSNTGGGGNGSGVTMRNGKTSCLDLSLSRLSVGENDSGVASSTCSTVGSEVAESVIGSIKMISRDLSEDAMKLKKQPHAVDDDGVQDVEMVVGEGNLTISKKMKEKLHEQQLAATIHPDRNCGGRNGGSVSDEDECTSDEHVRTNNGGGDVGLKGNKSVGYIRSGSGSDGEIIEIVDQDGNGNNSCAALCSPEVVVSATTHPPPAITPVSPPGVLVMPCENTISSTTAAILPQV